MYVSPNVDVNVQIYNGGIVTLSHVTPLSWCKLFPLWGDVRKKETKETKETKENKGIRVVILFDHPNFK